MNDFTISRARHAGHKFVSTETGLAATRRRPYLGRAVSEEVCLLTSPFIERLWRGETRSPAGLRGD
jgi:hypothetical protein